MSFIETPRFPADISYGSFGGYRFKTEIVQYQNGQEYINSRWSQPLTRHNVRYNIKSTAQIQNVYEFFLAMRGRANGFRVKDFLDFTSNANGVTAPTNLDQVIGTGTGSLTTFQLKKTYTKGSLNLARNIKKPVSGTVLIAKAGVAQTITTHYTLDTTTGIVTFLSAPANGNSITAGYEFDVPCRFDTDELTDIEYELNSSGGATTNIVNIPDIPIVEIRT